MPMTFPPKIINVFSVKRRKGRTGSSKAISKLRHSKCSVGNQCGGMLKKGTPSGFSAAVSIQDTGSSTKPHKANKNRVKRAASRRSLARARDNVIAQPLPGTLAMCDLAQSWTALHGYVLSSSLS